jgi:uncharacterized membrane-anchored protein
MGTKLDVQGVALAAAGTTGVFYLVCTIVVAIWPDAAWVLLSQVFHLVDITQFQRPLSVELGAAASGLIQTTLYAYGGGIVFALLYNWLGEKSKGQREV